MAKEQFPKVEWGKSPIPDCHVSATVSVVAISFDVNTELFKENKTHNNPYPSV